MAKIRNPLPMTIKWSGPLRREYFLFRSTPIKVNGHSDVRKLFCWNFDPLSALVEGH